MMNSNRIIDLNAIRLPAVRANMPVRECDIKQIQESVNILQRIYGVDIAIFPIVKAGDPLTAVHLNQIYEAVAGLDKIAGLDEKWRNFPAKSGDFVTEDLFNELIGTINRIILSAQTSKLEIKNHLQIYSLKDNLTDKQINILNIASKYAIDNSKCIPARQILNSIDQPKAKELIESIGGAYIFESNDNGKKCYQITFLGVMVSDYYPGIENLLVKYLFFVRDKFVSDPDCEYFSNEEIDEKYSLSKEDSEKLRMIISLAHLYHGSMSRSGTGKWTASYPEDVEELRFVDDIRDYIVKHALKFARLNDPVSLIDRSRTLFGTQGVNNLSESNNNSRVSTDKFDGKIDINNFISFLKRLLIGTISGSLMKLGAAFLIIGMWDVVIYMFDSYVLSKKVSPPGEVFEWPQVLGVLLFSIGLSIKFLNFRKENNAKLKEERLWLKENFTSLSDAKLQDEFERLFFVKNADIRAIKNILNHPYNKNKVISLFTKCHPNVLPKNDWFVEKRKYLNLRANISFAVWWLFPVLILATTIMAIAEYVNPGITQSGEYAFYAYIILILATGAGAKLVLNDIVSLRQAVTLVNECHPDSC